MAAGNPRASNIPTDLLGHLPLFTGTIYYVDASRPDDTGSGLTPDEAKQTITAAEAIMIAGDAVTIKSGTYTENPTFDLDGTEIWGEIGAIIVGTLTVSGDSCRVRGMIVAAAGAVGLAITGNQCRIDNVSSVGTPTIAFDIDGYRNILTDTRATGYSVSGYDIASYNTLIRGAIAQGAGAGTRRYYFSNAAADNCTLDHAKSAGNDVASVEFVTGCAGSTVHTFTSGFGDGRWVDADEAQIFEDFNFADCLEAENTLAIGGGGGTVAYNLYKVTGVVKINQIYGIVTTNLTGTNTDCFLDVFSANGSTPLSKNTTLTIGAAGVGSSLIRLDKADKVLTFGDATTGPYLEDEIDTKKEGFRLGEDRTAGAHVATYIRFTHTAAAAATGDIDWYVDWEPVSDDGWIEIA